MVRVSPRVTPFSVTLGPGLVLVVAVCALMLGASASAQSSTALALKELNKGSTFAFVDSAPMSKAKQRLQNTEIAERLFLAAKTVDHHVAACFRKLDVHTRAEATREAIRLGLTEER